MIVDVSQLLTVLGSAGTTALTLWAHGRQFKKEKRQTLEEYAEAQVEANGLLRDIRHLQRDFRQMSSNIAQFDREYTERFREIESSVSRLSGALEILVSVNRAARRAGD